MSETAIQKVNGGAISQEMSVDDVLGQIRKVHGLMELAMKDGEHYGVIPGTPKPTLLKAGAEKLCLMFRLDPQYEICTEEVEERANPQGGIIRYVVRATLYHIPTGNRIASGIGSCSSREEKYGWRKKERLCPECGAEKIIKGKTEYGGGWLCWSKKGGCGAKFPDGDQSIEGQEEVRIPNENIWEQENTILKMAEKRALVAAVLNGTAASDIFTQDIGDDQPVEAILETKVSHGKTYAEGQPQDQGCGVCGDPDWVVEDDIGRYCKIHAPGSAKGAAPPVEVVQAAPPSNSPQGASVPKAGPTLHPPEKLGWGNKYRDTLMSEVPTGYLRWCVEKAQALPDPVRDRITIELGARELGEEQPEKPPPPSKKEPTLSERIMTDYDLDREGLDNFLRKNLGDTPTDDERWAFCVIALILQRSDIGLYHELKDARGMSAKDLYTILASDPEIKLWSDNPAKAKPRTMQIIKKLKG